MTLTNITYKRLQTLFLILVLGGIAIAGLLLLMARLATPESPVSQAETEPAPEAVEQPAPEIKEKPIPSENDETIATVDGEIITRRAWEQATRLDAVMSGLVHQSIPTAEETLDRLVNEMIVLDQAESLPSVSTEAVEAKISALAAAWQVSDETIVTALSEGGLTRADLVERTRRLIQVETALNQLGQEVDDLDAWLVQARAGTEIGLYRSLASAAQAPAGQPASLEAGETDAPGATTPASVGVEPASFAPPAEMPISPYPENAAPDFTLAQLDGQPLTLSAFRGKPTIINFWATWCPPCRRELPALEAAYQVYQDQIGFVAVDVKESAETVTPFIEELGLTFPVAIDPDGRVSDVGYEVRGLPTTLFVDARGVVVARHVGPLDEATIESYLTPLLAPSPATAGPPPPVVDGGEVTVSATSPESAPVEQPDTAPLEADLAMAPDFTSTMADGTAVSLQDYRDKKNVVLVFYRGHT